MPPTRIKQPTTNNRPESALYGFLYLALRSDNLLKVGITLSPDRRKAALETASGLQLTNFNHFWLYNPAGAEKLVLNKFHHIRTQGEWLNPGKHALWLFQKLSIYFSARQARSERPTGSSQPHHAVSGAQGVGD